MQFMVDVGHSLEKQQYKMESEFEEIESIKLVSVQGLPTRALLMQVSMKLALLVISQYSVSCPQCRVTAA